MCASWHVYTRQELQRQVMQLCSVYWRTGFVPFVVRHHPSPCHGQCALSIDNFHSFPDSYCQSPFFSAELAKISSCQKPPPFHPICTALHTCFVKFLTFFFYAPSSSFSVLSPIYLGLLIRDFASVKTRSDLAGSRSLARSNLPDNLRQLSALNYASHNQPSLCIRSVPARWPLQQSA